MSPAVPTPISIARAYFGWLGKIKVLKTVVAIMIIIMIRSNTVL